MGDAEDGVMSEVRANGVLNKGVRFRIDATCGSEQFIASAWPL